MLLGSWASVGANTTLTSAYARTGTRCMRVTSSFGAEQTRRALPATKSALGFGMGLYCDSLPGGLYYAWRVLSAGALEIVTFYVTPAGQISVYRSGVNIGITDPVIVSSSFQHVETKVIRDSVVGEIEIRIEGVTVLHLTNLNLGSTDIGMLSFEKTQNVSSTGSIAIDDLVVWDTTGTKNNNFMGPQRVYTTFCDADTAVEDWTTTGAANAYQAVNNVPPDGDTTYIQASSSAQKIELELPAIPPEATQLAAVYVETMGKLTAAGYGNVQTSIVSGAAVANGPSTPLTTSYVYWPSVFEVDPNTGLPFTKTGFEAAKVRLEKTV